MATLTIRNLNEETKSKLRLRAAHHGHSMEEEVRRILDYAVQQETSGGLGTYIMQQFQHLDGIQLEIPPRMLPRQSPLLDLEDA